MSLILLLLALWPQRVTRHRQWPTYDHADSRYQDRRHSQDIPYRILIGENNSFCAVNAKDYTTLEGETFDCAWQIPHP